MQKMRNLTQAYNLRGYRKNNALIKINKINEIVKKIKMTAKIHDEQKSKFEIKTE